MVAPMIGGMSWRNRLICAVTAALLLFAQFAVASYACPNQHMTGVAPIATATEADDAANGCDAVDSVNPNLCLQHCQTGNQLPDAAASASPSASSSPMLEVALPAQADIADLLTVYAGDLLTRDTAPPLNIRNCCFRI